MCMDILNFEDYMDSVVFMMFHGGTLTYYCNYFSVLFTTYSIC